MCDEKCVSDIKTNLDNLIDEDFERKLNNRGAKCDTNCRTKVNNIIENMKNNGIKIADNLKKIRNSQTELINTLYSSDEKNQIIKNKNRKVIENIIDKKQAEFDDLIKELGVRTQLHLIQYDFKSKNGIIITDLEKKIIESERKLKSNMNNVQLTRISIDQKNDKNDRKLLTFKVLLTILKIVGFILFIAIFAFCYKLYQVKKLNKKTKFLKTIIKSK